MEEEMRRDSARIIYESGRRLFNGRFEVEKLVAESSEANCHRVLDHGRKGAPAFLKVYHNGPDGRPPYRSPKLCEMLRRKNSTNQI